MPYRIFIDPQHGAAYFTMYGTIDANEGKQAFIDYVTDPDFDPRFTMITDARQVTQIDATYRDILLKTLSLAKYIRLFRGEVNSVILVSHEFQFGMSRILEAVLSTCSPIKLHTVQQPHEILAHSSPAIYAQFLQLAPEAEPQERAEEPLAELIADGRP